MESPEANSPANALATAVIGCLERGGAVVTGNARAARSLRRLHGEAQRTAGKLAWPTPFIHDWVSWLDVLWKQHLQQAAETPLVLTSLQERAIWKRIAAGPMGDTEALAEMAAQAWALLSDYQAHAERNRTWSSIAGSDAEIFRGWAARFDRECRANRWQPRADLSHLLVASIEQRLLDLPGELFAIGFDRLTPAQQALLDAAQKAGSIVTVAGEPQPAASPLLIQAGDRSDELATCAWWARRTLEQSPDAKIAIVVQSIDKDRGEIERTFRQVLMPESVGIEAAEPVGKTPDHRTPDHNTNDAMPFEFSLGVSLATVPVVKAALLLLRWLAEPLEQSAISWLMLSGFLAAKGEDGAEMAALDADLRKHGQLPPEAPLDVIAGYRPRASSRTARRFLYRLRKLRVAAAENIGSRRQTIPEWIDFAESRLRQARWPGARPLESVEYQARKSWLRLLGEVAALGFDGSRASWNEFVTVLDSYAAATIFAPESKDAPIQIMGAFESAGQSFDALWFLGADDSRWPPAGQPNPLLPLWLQHKAGMPHSSLELDWELDLAVTRRLAASAPRIVFSHALRDASGALRPSAMIPEAVGRPLAATSSAQFRADLGVVDPAPHRRLTRGFEDASSIPWPKDIPAGGADVLKRQSACAFQSFAVRRLGAEELEAAERGLDPRDRGNLLHTIMEAFWSKENPAQLPLKTRDDLLNAKASGRLAEVLGYHIDTAFKSRFEGTPKDNPWFQAYLRVERQRLHAVLSQWLDYEAAREPFIVEEHERKLSVELLNGLKLELRVDRIDRVGSGRFILDYKTGRVAASMWEGDRPDEPQLPLYGAYGPIEDLRGVLFAQVRTGEMAFAGRVVDATRTLMASLSANSSLVQDPLDEEALGEWADSLSNLADQFLAGDAKVVPKLYPKTCTHCALPALCRVAEMPTETLMISKIDGPAKEDEGTDYSAEEETGSAAPWEIAADD